MGLDSHSTRFLVRALKQGVRFDNVLMAGRLKLDMFPVQVGELLRRHGLPDDPFRSAGSARGFSEDFFRCLGARRVESLDASAYEGATQVHDLNQPVPPEWREQWDVVCDGGTLEHVFNFPVGLRNCMEMVKVGGHLFLDAPANNWFGHGFYQLSPELFFRALSPENGYEVVEMIAHAAGPQARWYRVADPEAIRSRVVLVSLNLIHLMVHARRTRAVEIFRQMPQQSDYAATWKAVDGSAAQPEPGPGWLVRNVGRVAPSLGALLKAMGTGWHIYRSSSLHNRRFFTPIPRE